MGHGFSVQFQSPLADLDDEHRLVTEAQPGDRPIHALDDRALALREAEGFAAVEGTFDLRSVREQHRVVTKHHLAGPGAATVARTGHDVGESARRGDAQLRGGSQGGTSSPAWLLCRPRLRCKAEPFANLVEKIGVQRQRSFARCNQGPGHDGGRTTAFAGHKLALATHC